MFNRILAGAALTAVALVLRAAEVESKKLKTLQVEVARCTSAIEDHQKAVADELTKGDDRLDVALESFFDNHPALRAEAAAAVAKVKRRKNIEDTQN